MTIQINTHSLEKYLTRAIGPGRVASVAQFEGGQSNPTFLVTRDVDRFVLRKKPHGDLLPSAHAIDREFDVLTALYGTEVPVPRPLHYCGETAIIGQPFYLMEYVDGRVFGSARLNGASVDQRTTLYLEMAATLGKIHRFPWEQSKLRQLARDGTYLQRQLTRWEAQYRNSQTEVVPEIDELIAWLTSFMPPPIANTLVHGDYRAGNLVFSEHGVQAVLDWELVAIGDPRSDLAYSCLAWRLPYEPLTLGEPRVDGAPSEEEYVEYYCRHAGHSIDAHELRYFLVFAMFRSACINAGVYKRALAGNASSAGAKESGAKYRGIAQIAWTLAKEGI